MSRRTPESDPAQLTLPVFAPVVEFRPTVIALGNGRFQIEAGKPIVRDIRADDEVGTAEAARLIGLSQNRVIEMCDQGIFAEGTDWRRPGGPNGHYKIKRSAVLRQRQNT